jgi:beta-lactamase regulating signal transducer with metallopeptidase domain
MAEMILLRLTGLALRSCVVTGLAWLCAFRMREPARRHAVWVGALGILILMPVADIVLPAVLVPSPVPQWTAPITAIALPKQASAQDPLVVPPPSGVLIEFRQPLWPRAALALLTFIWVIFFLRLALAAWRIRQLRRNGARISTAVFQELTTDFRPPFPGLLESRAVSVPMTIGFLRPIVILPADWVDWDESKLRAVLSHELAHVRRCDWIVMLIAAIYKCTFWFNPIAWWLERQLSNLSEQSSDDAALSQTGDPAGYAEILLQFAAGHNGRRLLIGGVAMARNNMTNRIERILKVQKFASGAATRIGWLTIIAISVPVLYASAAVRLTPAKIHEALAPMSGGSGATALPLEMPPKPHVTQLAPAGTQRQTSSAQQRETHSDTAAKNLWQGDSRWQVQQGNPAESQSPTETTDQFLQDRMRQLNKELSELARVLEMAAQARQLESRVSTEPFSFTMLDVQGRDLHFTGGPGSHFIGVGYGCGADCSFLVFESGVMGVSPTDSGKAGVIFKLGQDSTEIAATCSAQECSLVRLRHIPWFGQGETIVRSGQVFSRGQTVTIPTSEPLSFTVRP